MSDSASDQSSIDSTTKSNSIVRFLNETEPAKLLICCAISLTLAAICGIASMKLNTGFGWSESYSHWDQGQDVIIPMSIDQTGNQFQAWTSSALTILGFLFGVIGAILPIWTVGRLISDAIRESKA